MALSEVGVGVIYAPELEPLIESSPELIDAIELEPQTTWRYSPGVGGSRFKPDADLLARLNALPQHKLVHGVGFPVGGTSRPDAEQLELFVQTVAELQAPWASEHLAFNRARGARGPFSTGFLLPPLQTTDGVKTAVDSIRTVAERLPVPFAVETGVNYLKRKGPMSDGLFVAEVADLADCGILLDLHNLWANERNGRQSIAEFIDEIPLERVWEIHVAGGLERDGYWLDAHSGAIPQPLLEVTADLVPALPNLRSIVFEILPSYIPTIGLDAVRRELEKLREVWDSRGPNQKRPFGQSRPRLEERAEASDEITPSAWENTLGALVIGANPEGALAESLARDPGVEILRELVWEFRAGAITDTLRLTTRLLLLHLGKTELRELLREFFASTPPELFGSAEAEALAGFLAERMPNVPYLPEVLGFERAAIRALVEERNQVVAFRYDPMPLLRAIAEGRVPVGLEAGAYEVEVTHDGDAAMAAHGRILTTT